MFGSILRKCRRCGHRVPIDSTHRVQDGERNYWACGECYRELVRLRYGIEQLPLELETGLYDRDRDLPF